MEQHEQRRRRQQQQHRTLYLPKFNLIPPAAMQENSSCLLAGSIGRRRRQQPKTFIVFKQVERIRRTAIERASETHRRGRQDQLGEPFPEFACVTSSLVHAANFGPEFARSLARLRLLGSRRGHNQLNELASSKGPAAAAAASSAKQTRGARIRAGAPEATRAPPDAQMVARLCEFCDSRASPKRFASGRELF